MDGKNGLEPGVMEATAAPARAQNAAAAAVFGEEKAGGCATPALG